MHKKKDASVRLKTRDTMENFVNLQLKSIQPDNSLKARYFPDLC